MGCKAICMYDENYLFRQAFMPTMVVLIPLVTQWSPVKVLKLGHLFLKDNVSTVVLVS